MINRLSSASFPLDRNEIVGALRQINALHDEGILTAEEYESKRKKLADKL
jgi:hypothetical protein